MNKYFNFVGMGFTLLHESKVAVDMAKFTNYISEDQLEELFNLGYYFTNQTHHITIANVEDYDKYIRRVK